MSGVVGKRACANEPGLGEAMPLGNGRADPSSVPCLGLPRIFHAARGRASSRRTLRPPLNGRLRTGTDSGNPTV